MDQPCISKCVREGEAIVVQVIKDPISDKGARLSANVTIPGRLVVLVPNQSGVALSRRIEDEAERKRLTDIVTDITVNDPRAAAGAGYIVRTAPSQAQHGEDPRHHLCRPRPGRAHHARRRRR
jgi:ribonuclease G